MTDMDPMAEPHTYRGPVPLDEVDPELIGALRALEPRWGSLGVALTAAQLSDVLTVIRCLEGPERAQRIRELEDRVLADIDARGNAEDLRRENAELRKILSEGATSEAAITTLREWTAGSRHTYEPGALMIAMPVSTAVKVIDGIDGLTAERDEARAIARNALHVIDNDYGFKELRYTLDEPGWTIPGLDAENYPAWLIEDTPTEGDAP